MQQFECLDCNLHKYILNQNILKLFISCFHA